MSAEDRDQLASELEEFGCRETDDPDIADARHYYKVEKWDAAELNVEALLYASNDPAGRLMFQVTGAFAEFERSMIRQRINAGLKRALDAGKQLGRPRIDSALEKRIQSQLRAGKGILKVAAECGVASGTVQRIKREMEESRPLGSAAA